MKKFFRAKLTLLAASFFVSAASYASNDAKWVALDAVSSEQVYEGLSFTEQRTSDGLVKRIPSTVACAKRCRIRGCDRPIYDCRFNSLVDSEQSAALYEKLGGLEERLTQHADGLRYQKRAGRLLVTKSVQNGSQTFVYGAQVLPLP